MTIYLQMIDTLYKFVFSILNEFQKTMKIIKSYDDGSGSGVANSGDGNGTNLLAFIFTSTTFT